MIALEAAAAEAAAAARDAAQASGQAAERARVAHARVAAAEAAVVASAEARLEALRRERTAVEAQISGAGGGQDEAHRRRLALGAVRERLGTRRESVRALLAALAAEHADAKEFAAGGGPAPAELEQAANEAAAAARAAASERDDLAERARATRERLGALELSIAEREGLTPAARALAELGERLALSEIEAEPGTERAVAAALGHRASALLAGDAGAALRLVERARADGLGSLVVLVGRDPQSLVAELPVVPLDGLLDSTSAAVTVEGFGFDPARGELWFAGETAEAVLLEMEARRRTLADEADELDARAKAAAATAAEAAAAAAAAEEAYAAVAHLRDRIVDPAAIARARRVVEQLESTLSRAAESAVQIDATLAAHAAAGAERSGSLGAELAAALGSRGGGPQRKPPTPRPEPRRPRCWSPVSVVRSTRSRSTAPTPWSSHERRPACSPTPRRRLARPARRPTGPVSPRQRSSRGLRGAPAPIPTCSAGWARSPSCS